MRIIYWSSDVCSSDLFPSIRFTHDPSVVECSHHGQSAKGQGNSPLQVFVWDCPSHRHEYKRAKEGTDSLHRKHGSKLSNNSTTNVRRKVGLYDPRQRHALTLTLRPRAELSLLSAVIVAESGYSQIGRAHV